jgi:outer membrane protein TolC
LGPQLAGTLLDGGLLKAGVASARARFLGASADYRKTVLTAFQEVEDALALANRYSEEAQATEAAVNAADATTRLSLIRYREGATNYLDVVTAQTAQLQNQEIALNLETRRQLASVALIKAIGGGWTRDALPSLRKAAAVEQKPRTP